MGYALRTDAFRYVQWRAGLTGSVLAEELYDQQSDPQESHSVIQQPKYAAQRAHLRRQLADQIRHHSSR